MYRNDHPTAGPNGEFLSEVPPSQPATKFPAELMTEWQEELANAIEGFGIALQKGTRTQLFDAMQSALGPANTGVKNVLLNAAMEVAQFGGDGSVSGVNGAQSIEVDRWRINPGGAGGNVQYNLLNFQGAVGEPAGNPKKFLRLNILGTQPGQGPRLVQRVESVLTLANQPVVVSFYARCGSGTLQVGVNLLQNFGSGPGASSQVFTATGNVVVGTSWSFYSAVVTMPSIAGKTLAGGDDYITVQLSMPDTGTYSLDVWGVQLERGTSPTSFERRSFSDELLRCMRYREMSFTYGIFPAGSAGAAGAARGYQPTPGDGVAGWKIWSVARQMRVLKRPATGGATHYLTWWSPSGSLLADRILVNGVVRAVASTTEANSSFTGAPVTMDNPGAGPSVCEAHWVWDDPVI